MEYVVSFLLGVAITTGYFVYIRRKKPVTKIVTDVRGVNNEKVDTSIPDISASINSDG